MPVSLLRVGATVEELALGREWRCCDSAPPDAPFADELRAGRAGAGSASCCLRPRRPAGRCASGDGEIWAAWSELDCATAGLGVDSAGAGTGAGGAAGRGESLPWCSADESGDGPPALCERRLGGGTGGARG